MAINSNKEIKNWGIDVDPKNDPTYPIKKRTNEEQKGYTWKRPTLQPVDIEVLHSNERTNITAVFGTAAPPSAISGIFRRIAFRYGEGSFAHWLLLLLADRLNEVEGVAHDISRGYIPNFFSEKGWHAEWKYNRKKAFLRIGKLLLLFVFISSLIVAKKKKGTRQKSSK